MSRPAIDLTGQRYGIMTVLKRDHSSLGGNGLSSKWIIRCDCGVERSISSGVLRGSHQQSCGCMRGVGGRFKPKYGIPTQAFQRWVNMMRRCYSPTSAKDSKHYMERGISVCKDWHDPVKYYADVGDAPFDGASIDRVNNDGNYEPSNVRWATASQQNKNRRPFKRGACH